MGKYLDIARKLEEQKTKYLDSYAQKPESATLGTMEGGIDFLSLLTEAEREQYDDLLEIMQSQKFGMDRETAKREAGRIVARYRQPLQLQQSVQDYKKYGYIKIYSTVLAKAIYLAHDEKAARRVPDQGIPVFLESDIGMLKGLAPEEVRVIVEAKVLLGGSITK